MYDEWIFHLTFKTYRQLSMSLWFNNLVSVFYSLTSIALATFSMTPFCWSFHSLTWVPTSLVCFHLSSHFTCGHNSKVKFSFVLNIPWCFILIIYENKVGVPIWKLFLIGGHCRLKNLLVSVSISTMNHCNFEFEWNKKFTSKEEVAFTFFLYALVVKCQATISQHLSFTFLHFSALGRTWE